MSYIIAMIDYDHTKQSDDYYRIERAIRYMDERFLSHPDLDAVASGVHLSKYHFHRIFKRWAGITPLQFVQFLTIQHTKQKLQESRNMFDASLDAGLSGPGRLHDLFITFEGMTPGQYKRQGKDLRISYGVHDTPFGRCLIATTPRGICHLSFLNEGEEDISVLEKSWGQSDIVEDPTVTTPLIEKIFPAPDNGRDQPFNLLLKGTNFQINVWKALLSIPEGTVVSYRDVAVLCGKGAATRAVAHAIANNPVSYLIPCHRVIKSTGEINEYRWGRERKKAILGWESSRVLG